MATYTCKYCGQQSPNANFAIHSCSKSPHKSHELMNATEKLPKYTCKYCGQQSPNANFAIHSCSKSPHGSHELLG